MFKIKRGDMSLVVQDHIAMLVKDPTQEVVARVDTSNEPVATALFEAFLEDNISSSPKTQNLKREPA